MTSRPITSGGDQGLRHTTTTQKTNHGDSNQPVILQDFPKRLTFEDFLANPENPLGLDHELMSRADSVRLQRKRGINRKRRSACRGPSSTDILHTNLQVHKKDLYEVNVLLSALKKSQFFRSVSDEELRELCKYFTPVYFSKGDPIIVQNDVGSSFYVIESGKVDIYKKAFEDGTMIGSGEFCNYPSLKTVPSPVKEHPLYGRYITTLTNNNYFGELAILLKCKRTASCVAASDVVKCWELRSEAFHKIGQEIKVSQFVSKMTLLRKMDLFIHLSEQQLETIVKNMKLETYQPSKVIVSQGEKGTHFYIILKGKVRVMKDNVMVGIIREGSYFGELALLNPQATRNASVVAIREVQCGVLSRECFHSTLFNTIYQRVLLNQISKYGIST